ncbi:hypothetical protein OK016_26640 [Vibrio chagasii]|nr:hypothetical protein [Vibrio chagasii]
MDNVSKRGMQMKNKDSAFINSLNRRQFLIKIGQTVAGGCG